MFEFWGGLLSYLIYLLRTSRREWPHLRVALRASNDHQVRRCFSLESATALLFPLVFGK